MRPRHPSISAVIVLLAVAIGAAAACSRREPPLGEADALASAAPLPQDASAPSRIDAGPLDAGSDAGARGATREEAERSGALPQTEEKPQASGALFDARVAALWDAIANDDPERAMPFFFPRAAYEQVKAITNPAADWQRRLVAAYRRDIHDLAIEVRAHGTRPTFVGIEVPTARARWVKPGEEGNRLGYFRVFGSKLRYDDDRGRARTLDVKSLIAWRGEWFVVHLSGFK